MYQSISMDEFYQKTKQETLSSIDVREIDEFMNGHIDGAKNIPLSTLAQDPQVATLDPSQKYYVICQMGGRSAQACAYLSQELDLTVINVMGGMSAWKGETVNGL